MDRSGWTTRHLVLNRLVGTEPLRTSIAQERNIFRFETSLAAAPANITFLPRRAARRGAATVPEPAVAAVGDAGAA
jgi:hypothetical protein